jgi:transposase InsO family protein
VTRGGLRWVVPKTARNQVVFYHHDSFGHFGAEKTLELVKQKYWFPRMKKYIKRYVSCCLACMYNKEPTGKQPGFLHPIPKFDVPLHTIHIDHLGPFVLSTRKNAYLIIAIDGFTKFAFLKAVRTTMVGPLLQFLDEIFNMFCVTLRIICDRGSSFTNKRFGEYCKTMGIKVNYNTTATPRANGQAERYNRTILNALSSSTDDERKWDEAVRHVQWGLNTSLNKTTGKTPYELLLGYRPRQANDSFLSAEVCDTPSDENLLDTRRQTSERIRAKQAEQKTRYDHR